MTRDFRNNLAAWRAEEAWTMYLHTVNSARRSFESMGDEEWVSRLVVDEQEPVPEWSMERENWPILDNSTLDKRSTYSKRKP